MSRSVKFPLFALFGSLLQELFPSFNLSRRPYNAKLTEIPGALLTSPELFEAKASTKTHLTEFIPSIFGPWFFLSPLLYHQGHAPPKQK